MLGLADPGERARVQVDLGRALHETGRLSEAVAALEVAHDAAVGAGERGVAALALIYVRQTRSADPEP